MVEDHAVILGFFSGCPASCILRLGSKPIVNFVLLWFLPLLPTADVRFKHALSVGSFFAYRNNELVRSTMFGTASACCTQARRRIPPRDSTPRVADPQRDDA